MTSDPKHWGKGSPHHPGYSLKSSRVPEYPGTEDNGASQGRSVKCGLSKNERTEEERG